MIGSIAIAVAFAASLGAIVLYALVARGKEEYLPAARATTNLAILSVFLTAGALLYYIFNYRFDIAYVYRNVSTSLSKPLLLATFYANQEGSFMLWALLTAFTAIFLMTYAARQRYEAPVMAVYMTTLAFLTLMIVVKSPFETIYSAFPGEAAAGFIPENGRGLNPTLENLWIVIHPPMLFAGFTLLAVPFSFAIAALLKRDYQAWATTSLPWTLGAGMILGLGIMLGGFWAYETLGWGGYWAWDPVENSSLMPWLVTIAATHTMLTQKRTGGLIRTNIAMTLLAYAFVLYSSFLTRSGILGDASVHSFTDPGATVFRFLLIGLSFFVIGSAVVFFMRWKDMTRRGQDYKILSREAGLAIGAAIIGASTLIVFVGTSAPLLAKKVDTSFYNDLHIPIAIALLLMNGLSLLLKWKQTSTQELIRRSIWGLALAAVATILVTVFGKLDEVPFIIMTFAAFFALFVNIEIGAKIAKTRYLGAYISHAGIAVFVIGVIASAHYEQHTTVQLSEKKPQPIFDGKYTLTFAGIEQPRPDYYHWMVEVKDADGNVEVAKPLSFLTDWNNRESAFREPDILKYATKDVYFTFMGIDMAGGLPTDSLKKGQKKELLGGKIAVAFKDYEFPEAERGKMMGGQEFTVKANVDVTVKSIDKTFPLQLSVTRTLSKDEAQMEDVIVPGTPYHLRLAELRPDLANRDNSQISIKIYDENNMPAEAQELMTIDVFIKPFINLVWAGIIVLVLGFAFSVVRRRKEAYVAIERAEREYDRSLNKRIGRDPSAGAIPAAKMKTQEPAQIEQS